MKLIKPICNQRSTWLPPENIKNQRFSDVFWEHKSGTLVENGLTKMFYSYYKTGFVIGLVQPYWQLHKT